VHILFVTPGFPPLPGGGERYAASLANCFINRGHMVTVVTTSAETERGFWQGSGAATTDRSNPRMTVIRCPIRPMRGGWTGLLAWRKAMVTISAVPGDYSTVLSKMSHQVPAISGLRHILNSIPGHVDIVNGFNISWENAMYAGWEWAREKQIPFVATPFMHFGSANDARVARNSMMDHQRLMLSQADAILTLTDIETQGLHEREINTARIETIGGGLDPLPKINDYQAALVEYEIAQPFIIFVGRASADKGALDAARAALQLRQQLVLVGTRTADFDKFYAQLSAEEAQFIRHVGIVPEVDKHALIAAAEMLLLPSRVDSFGIVLLEAWAHHKPVIAAHSGGIPGVVNDGEDGLLVPYGDVNALAQAVQRLLDNPKERAKMGNTGHAELATRFNWEHVSDHVLRIYDELIVTRQSN
jgi:glycosyltransferase involved in cell wall biosynthesis